VAEEEEKVPEDIEESSLKKEEAPEEPEGESSEEETSCPECGKTFDTEEGLRSHIGQVHPEYYGKEEEPPEGGEEELARQKWKLGRESRSF